VGGGAGSSAPHLLQAAVLAGGVRQQPDAASTPADDSGFDFG
jgi:hypothetical protein